MSEATLTIPTPKSCSVCNLKSYCGIIEIMSLEMSWSEYNDKRHENCPLKIQPECREIDDFFVTPHRPLTKDEAGEVADVMLKTIQRIREGTKRWIIKYYSPHEAIYLECPECTEEVDGCDINFNYCPFCGGEARIAFVQSNVPGHLRESYDAYCIKCNTEQRGAEFQQEAIAAWNKRKEDDNG